MCEAILAGAGAPTGRTRGGGRGLPGHSLFQYRTVTRPGGERALIPCQPSFFYRADAVPDDTMEMMMSLPTFRFVDAGDLPAAGDQEFWRDVEASDRLASPTKADLYLRELCRTRAAEKARSSNDIVEWEHGLLREVHARGYRLLGHDLPTAARRQNEGALQSA